jgi:hypothetical protein
MATVALLQEALVNSLVLNGPLGTTLGLDADDGDEASVGDDDDGSDGEALDTTLVRRGAELSGIARSAYSPLKELEELPNLEEEELPNSVAPPVGETKTMTQRLHERILSGGPPLPNMDERILSGGPPSTVPHVKYGVAQYGAAQQAAESRAAAAEWRPHANEEAEGAVMGANEEARQAAEGAMMGGGTEAAAKAKAKAEAAEAEAARVEALETARVALARSEQLEAEVPMPASDCLSNQRAA